MIDDPEVAGELAALKRGLEKRRQQTAPPGREVTGEADARALGVGAGPIPNRVEASKPRRP